MVRILERNGWHQVAAVAFCSGWWLAGLVLGFRHFLELWGRGHHSIPELIGAPSVFGIILPGAAPVFQAADTLGVSGLPYGFIGFLVGIVLGLAVWISMPLVLLSRDASRSVAVAGAVPYLAGFAGLFHLYQRMEGNRQLWNGSLAFFTAVGVYLIGAAVIFVLTLVFFAV